MTIARRLRRCPLALATLVVACSISPTGPGLRVDTQPGLGKRVLFVGNSLTYENDLPLVVRALSRAVRSDSAYRVGMIIGVRKLDLVVPHLAIGTELKLNVEKIRGDEDVSTFRAEALANGEPVCSAHLTLVHPETPPAD